MQVKIRSIAVFILMLYGVFVFDISIKENLSLMCLKNSNSGAIRIARSE